jgi:hypothetical protein
VTEHSGWNGGGPPWPELGAPHWAGRTSSRSAVTRRLRVAPCQAVLAFQTLLELLGRLSELSEVARLARHHQVLRNRLTAARVGDEVVSLPLIGCNAHSAVEALAARVSVVLTASLGSVSQSKHTRDVDSRPGPTSPP